MVKKFIIGLAGAPFGLNGFVKVRSLSGEVDHLLNLESVIIRKDEEERLLKIEESSPLGGVSGNFVIMRFKGINSPEDAKTLNGAQLLAGREEAAPLQPGEFYVEDLKGVVVFAPPDSPEKCGGQIGHITDILEGGGGELVEIKLSSGELKLIPFRKEFFTEINPQKGMAVLENLWILE